MAVRIQHYDAAQARWLDGDHPSAECRYSNDGGLRWFKSPDALPPEIPERFRRHVFPLIQDDAAGVECAELDFRMVSGCVKVRGNPSFASPDTYWYRGHEIERDDSLRKAGISFSIRGIERRFCRLADARELIDASRVLREEGIFD